MHQNVSNLANNVVYETLFPFSQLVVLHFEADWAEECKQMNEVLSELSKEYKHTIFLRVCCHVIKCYF